MISVLFGHNDHLPVLAGTALRLGLSAVLLLSASGKIWDMPGTRQAVSEFGVPPAHSERAARLLIGAEIGIALILLLDFTVRLGAALGALLFLAFTIGIVRVLSRIATALDSCIPLPWAPRWCCVTPCLWPDRFT